MAVGDDISTLRSSKGAASMSRMAFSSKNGFILPVGSTVQKDEPGLKMPKSRAICSALSRGMLELGVNSRVERFTDGWSLSATTAVSLRIWTLRAASSRAISASLASSSWRSQTTSFAWEVASIGSAAPPHGDTAENTTHNKAGRNNCIQPHRPQRNGRPLALPPAWKNSPKNRLKSEAESSLLSPFRSCRRSRTCRSYRSNGSSNSRPLRR